MAFYQSKTALFSFDDILVALHDLQPELTEDGVRLKERGFSGLVQLVGEKPLLSGFEKIPGLLVWQRLQEFDLRTKILKILCPDITESFDPFEN